MQIFDTLLIDNNTLVLIYFQKSKLFFKKIKFIIMINS